MLFPSPAVRVILVSNGSALVRPFPYFEQVISFHCEEILVVARRLIAKIPFVVLAGLIHCGSYL